MTSFTQTTKNSATYTKPTINGYTPGATFDNAIFDISKFDEPNDTFITYTKPTKNSTSYTDETKN